MQTSGSLLAMYNDYNNVGRALHKMGCMLGSPNEMLAVRLLLDYSNNTSTAVYHSF